jgi:uncharacterized membrane protein YhfC
MLDLLELISWNLHALPAWISLPAQAPQVSPTGLIAGIGMILVALGFIAYAGVRRLGWGYLLLGALFWVIAVALKFILAGALNSRLYFAITGGVPTLAGQVIFSLYIGALTGLTEVLLVWLVLRYTRLGQAPWKRALAFGIGFGAFEALLLGFSSLASMLVAILQPASLPPAALAVLADQSRLAWALAPVVERFFTILVHIFTSLLIFYAVVKREARWMWLAFLYKTLLDAGAGYVQLIGLSSLLIVWAAEAFVAVMGGLGWIGLGLLKQNYPPVGEEPTEAPEPSETDAQAQAEP